MKTKAAICVLLLIVLLSGCSSGKLNTAEQREFKYKYSRLLPFGIQIELGDAYVVTQATNFTSKYMAVLYNRSYRTLTGDEEKILFSDHYMDKMENADEYFQKIKEFYTEYKVTTELSRTDVHHVIMIGDDAYVNLTAYVVLQDCVTNDIAKDIGFSGIAGTLSQEYNLKIQYKNKEYRLYDIERVEGEKNIADFSLLAGKFEVPDIFETVEVIDNTGKYAEKASDTAQDVITAENPEGKKSESEAEKTSENTEGQTAENSNDKTSKKQPVTKENTSKDAADQEKLSEVRSFISLLAAKQNNRNYETMVGNEDYALLSDDYIAVLNREYNDIEYTKQVYVDKQLSTELVSVDIKSIDVRKNAYVVNVDIVSKITHCISEEEAKNIGYTGGIGSNGVMSFIYTVAEIDGELKLVNSKQTR